MDGTCKAHGSYEKCIESVCENQKVRYDWGGRGIDGKIILKWILEELGVWVWTACIWLGIESSGRLL
jgi:hypothetical protein